MRASLRRQIILLAWAGVLLATMPARAQSPGGSAEIADLDLDSLLDPRVAVVSLHEEQGSAAPASVFVLSRDDLRAHGFQTLAEALRSVPGLFTYSDGFYQYPGFRGVGLLVDYTVRILVLVDGHPINNSLGIAENSLGLDLLVPMAMVERIEVVKGPVGSVYGPAAFLGVVNVVTMGSAEPRLEAVAGARFSQGRAVASSVSAVASRRLGSLQVSAGAEAVWTPGYTWSYPELATATDRPAPAAGRVAGMDFGDAQKLYFRAVGERLTVQVGCGHWFRGLPSAPYSALIGDRRNREESLNCFSQVALEQRIGPDLVLSGRVSADWFDYRDLLAYQDPQPGAGGDIGPFRDHGRDGWASLNLQARWQLTPTLLATLGITGEAHRTLQESFAVLIPTLLVDPINGLGVGPIRKDFLTVNGYLLAEWQLRPSLALHAGLTAYRHQIFGSRLTPRAALVVRPSQRDTVKLVYTEGFRAPAASEAFFEDQTDYIANLGLRPETSRLGELSWERHFGAVLALSASVFAAEYGHIIRVETVPDPGLGRPPDPANPSDFRQQNRNGGNFGVRGAEIGGRLRMAGLADAYGGLSLQFPAGDKPPNFATLTANMAISTRAFWRPLSVAFRGFFVGARDKDPVALLPGKRTTVSPQVRLDATATLDVPGAEGLTVELSVLNLLDAAVLHPVPNDFAPITQMAEPPMTAQLALRYRR
jgi:iron complex outermembrane receptor protein